MKTEKSGFRIQNPEWEIRTPGRWIAALMLLLAAGCAGPKAQFTDEAWISHSATGRGSYERGDFRRASESYARAEKRAQAMDNADALAVSTVNRAVCLLAEGKEEIARARVEEALADTRVSRERRGELMATGARVELALDHPEEAKQYAVDLLNMNPSPVLRAQALLAKSAAELAAGDSAQAAKTLTDGLSAKKWRALPAAFRAEQSVRFGELAEAEGRTADAAVRQMEAADLWRAADRLPEMAQALATAGRLSRASGTLPAACDLLYRAARSQWAQGLPLEAAATLAEGVKCAEELKDEAVIRRMAGLLVTLQDESRLAE